MRKTMRCGSILVKADEVLFAIANTGTRVKFSFGTAVLL